MMPRESKVVWDPAQYGRFSGERGRAFAELVARIPAGSPRHVVDLGCGSGELTAALARRWPDARIDGIDSSAEMIAAARTHETLPAPGAGAPGVRFSVGDVREWRAGGPVEVILSNAVLQWVPGHEDLLPRWIATLAPGGCLAFQVPGNFGEPSHVALREICSSPRWRDRLGDRRPERPVLEPAGYLELLAGLGCTVDAWETTYLQVLDGPDPVLDWVRGTALRPILSALEEPEAAEFLREYGARLRQEYPAREFGTVFPFRRIFVVARRPG